MARDTRIIATCDPCDQDGYPNVMAIASHIISLDGKGEREIDVCVRDEVLFQRLAHVYEQAGRPVRPPEKAPAKKKAKAVRTTKPKELEAPAPEEPPKPPTEPMPKQYLLCPLPHGQDGAPKRIEYTSRGGHADMVHGLKLWEIEWEDPDRILKFTCPSHAECVKKGVGFTTKKGVGQHVRSCPLPRIDQGDDEASMKQEGDPQTSDELAP